jgi:DNA-binding GntR family transcriptional regulator
VTKLEMVSERITSEIERGTLREGDLLPSEEKLAEQHGVSVGTVQKALARLAHLGLISREHGRGTFVKSSGVAPADIRYMRFRDDDGRDLVQYVHVSSIRRVKKKGPWSEFLGGETFVRIERTINMETRLAIYAEFYLREEEFLRLGVPRGALENNLRSLLDKRLALPTLRADQWIRFVPLPPAAARALGIKTGKPGFVMELRCYTLRDQPLSYQVVYSGPFSERFVVVR